MSDQLPGVLGSDGSDRPVGLLALAIEHPVPCNDCGSSFWPDWTLLPHAVFNAVCPDGGYLCLPCFARRVIDKERLMTNRLVPASVVTGTQEQLKKKYDGA